MFDLLSYFLTSLIFAFLILLGIYWVRTYNSFHYLTQTANERLSNVEVLLRQRLDMIPAIIATAKKYNLHENTTFREVTEARNNLSNKTSLDDRIRSISSLDNSFLKLNAVVESYPILKADLIQSEVLHNNVLIENQISSARHLYNSTAREYNFLIHSFPQSLIAHTHNFKPITYLSFPTTDYIPKTLYD